MCGLYFQVVSTLLPHQETVPGEIGVPFPQGKKGNRWGSRRLLTVWIYLEWNSGASCRKDSPGWQSTTSCTTKRSELLLYICGPCTTITIKWSEWLHTAIKTTVAIYHILHNKVIRIIIIHLWTLHINHNKVIRLITHLRTVHDNHDKWSELLHTAIKTTVAVYHILYNNHNKRSKLLHICGPCTAITIKWSEFLRTAIKTTVSVYHICTTSQNKR